MPIANVELNTTFDEWRVRTNQLIVQGDQLLVSVGDLYPRTNSMMINANTSYNIANFASIQANTARLHANAAHLTANAGYDQANTARNQANTGVSVAGAGISQANTARNHANVAFEQANTARNHANAAFGAANVGTSTVFTQANTARDHANAAFGQANTARSLSNAATAIAGGGAGQVPYQTGSGVTAFITAGTSGQALISKGTASPVWADVIPAGTIMLFGQTAAPTGWTKITTHNDKALRVVSGTAGSGGTVAFTTAFASKAVSGSISSVTANGTIGATTLTTAQMPLHGHPYRVSYTNQGTFTSQTSGGFPTTTAFSQTISEFTGTPADTQGQQIGGTGGGGSHTHSFTGSAHGHTFTGTAIDLAVQYVDVILASKDAY